MMTKAAMDFYRLPVFPVLLQTTIFEFRPSVDTISTYKAYHKIFLKKFGTL